MAIIRYTKDATIRYAYLNIFPDQFKTEKEKMDESWVKNTMDYFANKAYAEYVKNRETFVKNYDLVKGILRAEDFYEVPEVKSFTEMLKGTLELPKYVKHYSILTPPINTLLGELVKRPDIHKVKAFDDDSRSEELEIKTQILQDFIVQKAKQQIEVQLAQQGQDPSKIDPEQLQQMTMDKVQDQLSNYTSAAEKWANHILSCQKVDLNMKERSEDAFRDLLISAREYFHIYEDNSKLGFNIEVANPKNVWVLTTPDRKYTSDNSARGQGAYAAGTVEVMEISEIIEKMPDLTKEEIDHLRSSLQDYGLINVRESNLGNPNAARGIDSIQYDTYDPLVLRTRMIIESEMKENNDSLKDFLGLTSNVSAFGYKYVVVRAYWMSKTKIGKVTYEDEMGNIQSTFVDENYKQGDIPTQIGKTEWGWINQWYQGTKIGPDIYHIKPYKLLNYCPIIGQMYELKNTEARSLVDLMKPFQVIYNVCMNQLFKLLEKEIGNVAAVNIRRVPRVKDGDGQDDIDIWELEARERGILFDDDSPENTKAPVTNTSVVRNVDLTRSSEIQARYNLAVQMKNECWELIGLNRQRLGAVQATETATGTNTALSQSYAQTEPIFAAHEYIMNQVYQAIVDAAQYVEAKKPLSTVSYITNEGEAAFVEVNGTDLKLRDLKVYVTSRPQDIQAFNELRLLAQPLLQNGGSFTDVIELYSTNSIRQMKEVFTKLRQKQEQMQQQQQQLEQQKVQQQQEQFQQAQQQAYQQHQEEVANENYNKELDRLNKKEVALIMALGRNENATADVDRSGVADALEVSRLSAETDKANRDYAAKMQEIHHKQATEKGKLDLEYEKLKVERENMKNDLQIARENRKGRGSSSKSKK
jgi:hypothetical protein